MTDAERSGRRSTDDLVPLAERVRALLILRLALVAAALAVCALPQVRTAPLVVPLVATGAYVLTSLVVELARRHVERGLGMLAVGLLLDGVYLAAVCASTGATASPLLRLVEVHTIAVTLLASYRTGLKLALWHSLLLDGLYQLRLGAPGGAPLLLRDLVVATAALWGLALGAGLFSAVNERELRRRRVELQALVSLSAQLESSGGPETMAEVLAEVSAETFMAERAVVLASLDGADLEPLAGWGDWVRGERVAPGEAVREAWSTAGPVLLRSLDPGTDPDLATALPDGTHVVVLPMLAESNKVGVLVLQLGHHLGGRVERRLLDTAGQFAAHASLAMQNAWLLREVGRLAATDALTGLANRRTLATELERALSRGRRTNRPVSMVLVDVDHFKLVNDTYGHRTGDELLRSVADTLGHVAGGSATAARYGGEEFALLLPEATRETATRMAEAVRRAIPHGTDPRVTVSLGVATLVPGDRREAGYVEPDLVSEADRALYAAKRGGRDRVVHVDDLDSHGEAPPRPADAFAPVAEREAAPPAEPAQGVLAEPSMRGSA